MGRASQALKLDFAKNLHEGCVLIQNRCVSSGCESCGCGWSSLADWGLWVRLSTVEAGTDPDVIVTVDMAISANF